MSPGQKITTFLTFDHQAEEAATFYVSVFQDARIRHVMRLPASVAGEPGKVMSVQFELAGQHFIALNGGPHFQFSTGISLFVSCNTQAEIDHLWEALAAGGTPDRCGWLQDKFGVSWQIVPPVLGQLLSSPDTAAAGRVMQAMLQMSKLDIDKLQQAAA